MNEQGEGGAQESWIAELIREATRAEERDLVLIERIMRDQVFHSTLDWQSRSMLLRGARAAYECLEKDRGLFESEHGVRVALFRLMQAESVAESEPSKQSREAAAAARTDYEAAKGRVTLLRKVNN